MITNLKIRNFKCFGDLSLDFGKLTLLSGLNGMGKSTIIQALLLLRQSYQQGLLPNEGITLNGELANIGMSIDALYTDANEQKILIGLESNDDLYAEWTFDWERETEVLPLVSKKVNPKIFDINLFSNNFCYVAAERIGPRKFFEMSAFKVKKLGQIGTKGEYSMHFLSINQNEKIANIRVAHPKGEKNTLISQVEAWMQEIRPGTRINIEPHSKMDLLNLTFAFEHKRSVSPYFRSTNVGFGITYTLPILIALISAKPGSLVVLENPEAHLHPQGQAKLGELIALASSGGVQTIIESHSDHVLNGIRLATYLGKIEPNDIFFHFFEQDRQADDFKVNILSPKITRNGRIDKWPTGFFDVWDDYLEKFITPIDELKQSEG